MCKSSSNLLCLPIKGWWVWHKRLGGSEQGLVITPEKLVDSFGDPRLVPQCGGDTPVKGTPHWMPPAVVAILKYGNVY